ncbi:MULTISPECIES: MFS transporter [Ralstonia solanacearum species complex]|uniref:MFS transporter n=1 Tax=Ralstonia solanacearum species complex TaxID=3116862 RepID=UPI000E595E43|nr:MFS transporter [Ralstonia solanacearum]BEU74948.1 MFS transporter [Ralstonia pseudosolanacearum]AXV79750.1 MFS transporter [Ralstonia solanacearum]AXV93778.1 MFS transporter [Ralstonia solanacearum]AXW21773.1 MFS transporter [Ralstonia solanacearum]AXW78672.1 MFS transporter [Ralstonia solanacearum]
MAHTESIPFQSSVPLAEVEESRIVRKIAWRIMPLIMVCYLFAFFDRINISFAKFSLQADLGLSDTAYGLGAGLFVVGYVLFEVPSNLMLYKAGARRWIARIMVSWGIATALMAFVQTEWQFYILRFLIGAMEAGFAPGVLYYLTLWFPAAYRGRMTSMLFLASAFAGLLGAPASGLVLSHMDGVLAMRGWHWLFLVGGVPCVLLGFAVFKLLNDRIEDARWLKPEEQALLSANITRQNRDIGGHSLLDALKTPGFLTLGLVYFLIQVSSYGLNFWAPHMIRASGISNSTTIGFLTAVPYLCGAIAMVIVGQLSDRSGERRQYVIGLMLLASLGFFCAGVFDQQTEILVAALALMGAGVVAAIPAFWALPPRLVTGAGAAAGIALINTLGQLGGIVSPVVVGRIKDMTGSTTPALYLIGSLGLVCAAILTFAMPAKLRARD